MTQVGTAAYPQFLHRARPDNVDRSTGESTEIELLPPPSYDLAIESPTTPGFMFPTFIPNSLDVASSADGPASPPPNDRARWYHPEEDHFYSPPVPTAHQAPGSPQPWADTGSPSPNTPSIYTHRRTVDPNPPLHTRPTFPIPESPGFPISTPSVQPVPRQQMPGRNKHLGIDPTTLPTALCISQSLMTAVNTGKDQAEIGRLIQEVIQLGEDENQARKMVEAGAIPHLITQFQKNLSTGERINDIVMAIGLLSHDLLSANSIIRSGTATLLAEFSKAAQLDPVRACLAWCLGRMIQSDDIAAKFIEDGLPDLLLNWLCISDSKDTQRYSAWVLGTLARTDILAEKLVQKGVIPVLTSHLMKTAVPDADSEDLCVALFGVARLARTIKCSKALAAAGSVEPMVRSLQQSLDPDVLNWSARAIGCHMRPNSSDMAQLLLWEGAAEGLARLPRSIPPEETEALGSFAFAVARFSCAEWGSGTRKALVRAGVVDALLSALRAASAIHTTNPQVHAELAVAVSFLGDIGGSAIRKEIRDAGGVDILKKVARQGPPDVQKACEMAITVITGNVFTRSSASAKTAFIHDWSGGCPEYPIIHPDFEGWR
ncbi:unnamed protein product [Rhizoctonia solani]|uniref:Uncharacterized protein n=1 Tax=Rhizoctonia solani TaxID=456999 RepID=A0A8H3E5R4_9AGAM|nr:unnamed protein product [Rhizoctonia solani]